MRSSAETKQKTLMKKKAKTKKIAIPIDSCTSSMESACIALRTDGESGDLISIDTISDYIDIDARQLYAWLKEHYENN